MRSAAAMKIEAPPPIRVVPDLGDPPTPTTPEPGDSWLPKNLLDHEHDPPPRPSIGGCLYAGRRHLVSGESEAGKSWLALAWCAEVLHHGGRVVYIDHEMGASMTLERLRVLGVPDSLIPRFRYVDPQEPITRASEQASRLVASVGLVVVDSTIGSLAMHAYDPNTSSDIERWYMIVVDTLRQHGAAVVVLDHVTKNPETRGKYAIGSERKVGAADVHLSIESINPFGRDRVGKSKVLVKKDRPGHLPRPTLGTFTLNPTSSVAFGFTPHDPDDDHDQDGHFRPTVLMERVSKYLETYGPETPRQVELSVKGKAEGIRKAIEALLREGFISNDSTTTNWRKLTSLKPFRDSENPTGTSDSGTRPECVPDASTKRVPPPPTPKVEGRVEGTHSRTQTRPPKPTIHPALPEPCPNCNATHGPGHSIADATYCCHPCAAGDICACKYQETSA
jgi:hypothetical protein